ncbi:MAG: hypothetical protein GEV11_15940 [Streptosporangiales bacterium]|nr:hypothetical protein [Streptosporangiales bacterium]
MAGVDLPAGRVVEGAFTRDGGYAAARRLISQGAPATCIFATTDVMAIGAMAAFREHGLRVPGDLSLAGFDDIPIVADLSPPLTTVRLPLTEMGERVMALVLRDRPDGRGRSRMERVGGEVVLRGSTAPPQRKRE